MSLKTVIFVGDGRVTIHDHLKLYRAGKVGPLSHTHPVVDVGPCRSCGTPRPDDGTPCKSCGAYKHCVYQSPGVKLPSRGEVAAPVAPTTASRRGAPASTAKPTKLANPRRNKRNAS